VMWVMSNLISVRLETMLVSVQDRCMVSTKCSIGSEIILDAPDGTPRCEAEVEASFGLFGDNSNLTQDRCTICAERTTGSEIVLDAPNGTAT
jgi:hypothetical protein